MNYESRIMNRGKRGFSMIEVLIVLFIFSVVTVTFYSVISKGSVYMLNAKNRFGATALANKKLEVIRNLPYDSIGVDGGPVDGDIPEYQTVTESGRSYLVHTNVNYVDDDFDGETPADTAPDDYKKATVTVSWTEAGVPGSVTMHGRFVPQGLEVAHPGNGILLINVFSDQPGGVGIAGSHVHVVNSATGLNTTQDTDASGSLYLTGDTITASIKKYEITASKTDHETVQTYPPYPISTFNPVDVHGSVVLGSINVVNIVQNELADLKIQTQDSYGTAIPDIHFSIVGGRKMGTDTADPPNPLYNLTENSQVTNSSGEKDFGQVSPGQYAIGLISPDVDNYEIIGSNPKSPLVVMSNDDITYAWKLAPKNVNSLLINVTDQTTGLPLENATVKVTNGLGYDSGDIFTLDNGNAFFPTTAGAFAAETYDISVMLDGYNDYTGQATVTDGALTKTAIALVRS